MTSNEEHKIWSTMANKKLESIYNQLCELEILISSEDHVCVPKLSELLETISEIQEHHHAVVQNIVSSNDSICEKRVDLENQMELLEKSIDLLKLETNWKEPKEQELMD